MKPRCSIGETEAENACEMARASDVVSAVDASSASRSGVRPERPLKLVPRREWNPAFVEPAGPRWPLERGLHALAHPREWPALDDLQRVLDVVGVTNACGRPLRVERDRGRERRRSRERTERWRDDLYDARIDGAALLPTRERSFHDLFNVLVWASFPRAKAALAARQHRAWKRILPPRFTRLPSARTSEQDALAIFDEGGVVLAATAPVARRVVASLEQRALGELESVVRDGRAVGLAFGHALHEHFVSSNAPVRAATLVLVLEELPASRGALVDEVDVALARALASSRCFDRPSLPSLPVHVASPVVALPPLD